MNEQKRAAAGVFIPLLIYMAGSRFAFSALYSANLPSAVLAVAYTALDITTMLLLAVMILLPGKLKPSISLASDGRRQKAKFRNVAKYIVAAFSVCMLTQIVCGLFIKDTNISLPTDENMLVAYVFSTVILAPILEECVFRMAVIKRLLPCGRLAATVMSALVFSLMHDFCAMPYAFVAGIVFAAGDLCFDSILPSLSLHFFLNLYAVAVTMTSGTDFAFVGEIGFWLFLASCAYTAILLLGARGKMLVGKGLSSLDDNVKFPIRNFPFVTAVLFVFVAILRQIA